MRGARVAVLVAGCVAAAHAARTIAGLHKRDGIDLEDVRGWMQALRNTRTRSLQGNAGSLELVEDYVDIQSVMGIPRGSMARPPRAVPAAAIATAEALGTLETDSPILDGAAVHGEMARLPDGRVVPILRAAPGSSSAGRLLDGLMVDGRHHGDHRPSSIHTPLHGVIVNGTLYAGATAYDCVPVGSAHPSGLPPTGHHRPPMCPAGKFVCTVGGTRGLCLNSEQDAAAFATAEEEAGYAAARERFGLPQLQHTFHAAPPQHAGGVNVGNEGIDPFAKEHARRLSRSMGRRPLESLLESTDSAKPRSLAEQQLDASTSRGSRRLLAVRIKYAGQPDSSAVSAATLLDDAKVLGIVNTARSFGAVVWNVTVMTDCVYELASVTAPTATVDDAICCPFSDFVSSAVQTAIASATATGSFTRITGGSSAVYVSPALASCRVSGLVSNYDHLAIWMPASEFIAYGGLGHWPGSLTWYNGGGGTIVSHEVGHNLGLGHASTLPTGTTTLVEYGDLNDRMGRAGSYLTGDYSAGYKQGLGFIGVERTVQIHPYINPSATFVLAAVDRDTAPGNTSLPLPAHVALTARAPIGDPLGRNAYTAFLFLTYRATASGIKNGIYINKVPFGPSSMQNTVLVCPKSPQTCSDQTPLQVGESFLVDPTSHRILVEVIAKVRISNNEVLPANTGTAAYTGSQYSAAKQEDVDTGYLCRMSYVGRDGLPITPGPVPANSAGAAGNSVLTSAVLQDSHALVGTGLAAAPAVGCTAAECRLPPVPTAFNCGETKVLSFSSTRPTAIFSVTLPVAETESYAATFNTCPPSGNSFIGVSVNIGVYPTGHAVGSARAGTSAHIAMANYSSSYTLLPRRACANVTIPIAAGVQYWVVAGPSTSAPGFSINGTLTMTCTRCSHCNYASPSGPMPPATGRVPVSSSAIVPLAPQFSPFTHLYPDSGCSATFQIAYVLTEKPCSGCNSMPAWQAVTGAEFYLRYSTLWGGWIIGDSLGGHPGSYCNLGSQPTTATDYVSSTPAFGSCPVGSYLSAVTGDVFCIPCPPDRPYAPAGSYSRDSCTCPPEWAPPASGTSACSGPNIGGPQGLAFPICNGAYPCTTSSAVSSPGNGFNVATFPGSCSMDFIYSAGSCTRCAANLFTNEVAGSCVERHFTRVELIWPPSNAAFAYSGTWVSGRATNNAMRLAAPVYTQHQLMASTSTPVFSQFYSSVWRFASSVDGGSLVDVTGSNALHRASTSGFAYCEVPVASKDASISGALALGLPFLSSKVDRFGRTVCTCSPGTAVDARRVCKLCPVSTFRPFTGSSVETPCQTCGPITTTSGQGRVACDVPLCGRFSVTFAAAALSDHNGVYRQVSTAVGPSGRPAYMRTELLDGSAAPARYLYYNGPAASADIRQLATQLLYGNWVVDSNADPNDGVFLRAQDSARVQWTAWSPHTLTVFSDTNGASSAVDFTCIVCGGGKSFGASPSAAEPCRLCPAGTTAPVDGASSVSDCVAVANGARRVTGDACSNNNGGCGEARCSLSGGQAVCSCPAGSRLADDRRSCIACPLNTVSNGTVCSPCGASPFVAPSADGTCRCPGGYLSSDASPYTCAPPASIVIEGSATSPFGSGSNVVINETLTLLAVQYVPASLPAGAVQGGLMDPTVDAVDNAPAVVASPIYYRDATVSGGPPLFFYWALAGPWAGDSAMNATAWQSWGPGAFWALDVATASLKNGPTLRALVPQSADGVGNASVGGVAFTNQALPVAPGSSWSLYLPVDSLFVPAQARVRALATPATPQVRSGLDIPALYNGARLTLQLSGLVGPSDDVFVVPSSSGCDSVASLPPCTTGAADGTCIAASGKVSNSLAVALTATLPTRAQVDSVWVLCVRSLILADTSGPSTAATYVNGSSVLFSAGPPPSPSITPSRTPTPSITSSVSPSPVSPSVTPSNSVSPSISPSRSPTSSPTPSYSPNSAVIISKQVFANLAIAFTMSGLRASDFVPSAPATGLVAQSVADAANVMLSDTQLTGAGDIQNGTAVNVNITVTVPLFSGTASDVDAVLAQAGARLLQSSDVGAPRALALTVDLAALKRQVATAVDAALSAAQPALQQNLAAAVGRNVSVSVAPATVSSQLITRIQVTLASPPPSPSATTAPSFTLPINLIIMAAAAGLAAILIIALVVIICCCCCCRKAPTQGAGQSAPPTAYAESSGNGEHAAVSATAPPLSERNIKKEYGTYFVSGSQTHDAIRVQVAPVPHH